MSAPHADGAYGVDGCDSNDGAVTPSERTEYDSGPGCKVCDRRILWREGQGWLHAFADTGPLVLYPHEDPYGHEAEGSWA